MSKREIKYLHIFIWLFAIFANLPYSGITSGMHVREMTSYIIGFLYLIVVFYTFYFFIVPKFLNRNNLAGFLIISFLVILIMPFFGYLLLFTSRAVFDGSFDNFFRGYSFKMHMSGFYPVLTAAVFGSFFRSIINWFDTINQKTILDKQKLSVELELLKSKLNPHFLFNTLNNIDSLIQTDREKASSALIRLSDMMRYLTYETTSPYVELEKEKGYIINMIELYRLRLKTPESIRFDFSGDMKVPIAPGMFVPVIENAFKYTSFRNTVPSVDIQLTSELGNVLLDISNFYDKVLTKNGDNNSGFGISNLRRRLELIYPGRHELIIDSTGQMYHVMLKIDTNGD